MTSASKLAAVCPMSAALPMLMTPASKILLSGFQICNDMMSSLKSLLQVLDVAQPCQTTGGSLGYQKLRFDVSFIFKTTEYEQLEAAITVCSHVKCLPAAEAV